jgi:glycogen operon protein
VLALRAQQKRNFLTTLFLSQGVPMVVYGDEVGRSQRGNNNAYCQDNEISWLDWDSARDDEALAQFTAALSQLRREHPIFRRRRFFAGRPIRKGDELRDIAWFTPSGEEMTEHDWDAGFGKSLAVFLNGDGMTDRDNRGERLTDDSFLICFNAHYEELPFTTPNGYADAWEVVLDTAQPDLPATESRVVKAGVEVPVPARALLVLRKTL